MQSDRAALAAPILERTEEVAALGALLTAARSGEGGCAVVEGRAGIGKSRLLTEAREGAEASGMAVASARCSPLESDFSFGAALQLFEPRIDDDLFGGAAALARPLFEAAGGADERDFSRLHGLHWLAANLADRRPLLIVVDDAHWCDVPTLRFLLHLVQRVDELPIAVVVATRTGEEGPQRKLTRRLAAHDLTRSFSLAPLSEAAVTELVRSELDPAAGTAFCHACTDATGGNPLFVHALLAGVRESGGGVDDAAAERLPELGADALADAVTKRLDAMADGARELAQALAVLGDGASLGQLAALAEVDEVTAEARLGSLTAAGILDGTDGVAFAHPILRSAVGAAIEPSRRAQAHRRAARLLSDAGADPERVASHLLASGEGGRDPRAVESLREAAARASARGAPEAAARYLRAVVASSDGEADVALLRQLALVEIRSHDSHAAARVAAALGRVGDVRTRGDLGLHLGLAQLDAGTVDAAGETFAAALEGLPEDLDLTRTLRACRSAASGLGHAHAPAASLDPLVERAGLGLTTRAERLQLAHAAMAAAFAGKNIEDVRRLGRAALLGDSPDPRRASEVSALILGAVALVVADELDIAEQAVDDARENARRVGSFQAYASAAHVRAWINHRRGRLGAAIADAESVLDAGRYGWEPALPAASAVMALCHLERNERVAAGAALDLPGGEERWRTTFTWNDYLDARGRVRLADGDARGALEDFQAAGTALEAIGASHTGVVPWRSGAVLALAALGDLEEARRLADEDIELSRAFGARSSLGLALRIAGRIAGGDRGIALLREAVDVLAGSPAELELAHARADLGAALLEGGHRVVAREPLKAALDAAHACGAEELAARAGATLVAAGARPRRPALRGRDSLTPRELRLAEMAAGGMTNREIAESLFITTKTVETHLRHAYEKLGIASRRELSAALGS